MENHNEGKLVILRRRKVEERTGLTRSTLYLKIKKGTFPHPVKLGPRSVGWIESEVNSWLESKIQAREKAACRA